MSDTNPRRPRVFDADDPALDFPVPPTSAAPAATAAGTTAGPGADVDAADAPPPPRARSRPGWGSVLLSALLGLALLGIGAWFARLASAALLRDDWVGWVANGLLVVAGVAALGIAIRELAGLARLSRLTRLRKTAEAALRAGDKRREREAVRALKSLLAARPELARPVQIFSEHEADVREAGELLRLADRELLVPLDAAARRLILGSGKRVAIVTAMLPTPLLAMVFVLYENLRLLKRLAGLYGGRPGGVGAWRLARMVVAHIVATGGVALTDDLLGQFLGQDLLRRLSRRLGEGAFNAALTARIGAAAVEVTRPLPYIEARPVRARDLVAELFRKSEPAAVGPRAGRTPA
ncbi:MAG: TIGR01620 family protein [Pseudomonadota bacterium]